jgi:hypothetical protein
MPQMNETVHMFAGIFIVDAENCIEVVEPAHDIADHTCNQSLFSVYDFHFIKKMRV